MADGREVEAVAVNYGTFTTVKKLRNELHRMLDDNNGNDISLEPPISATGTQQGSRFISVKLEAGLAKH
jgi:hypothetical protein